jgi:hypothetical protein
MKFKSLLILTLLFLISWYLVNARKSNSVPTNVQLVESKNSSSPVAAITHRFQNAQSPVMTSNEILAAYLRSSAEYERTSAWYFAELGKGDKGSLRKLKELALTTNRTEVKALLGRIMVDPKYDQAYRVQAINSYATVTDGEPENSAVPALVTCMSRSSDLDASRDAFLVMSLLLDKKESLAAIQLIENALKQNPGNHRLFQTLQHLKQGDNSFSPK